LPGAVECRGDDVATTCSGSALESTSIAFRPAGLGDEGTSGPSRAASARFDRARGRGRSVKADAVDAPVGDEARAHGLPAAG
jgi:hypothetical protein